MASQGTFLRVADKSQYHIEFIEFIFKHKKQAGIKNGYLRGV